MDSLVSAAEAQLRRHPAPAVPLLVLLRLLREAGSDRLLDVGRLRTVLERHPERFRILQVWRAPLDEFDGDGIEGGADNPWVALLTEPAEPDVVGLPPTVCTMRESVRWLARRMDDRSRTEALHWQRLVLAEREARTALTRVG